MAVSVAERLRYGKPPTAQDVTVIIPFLSTDNREYLERAIASFPAGTKYIVAHNDGKPGEMAEALNMALAEVDTDWILPFGADDVAVEGMIEELCGVAFDADVVYPFMLLVDESLETVVGEHPAWPFCGNRLLQLNFVPGCGIVRTELMREVGGWRDMPYLEDWDYAVRLYRAGARFKPCKDAKMLYRQRRDSRNSGLTRDAIRLWRDEFVGERPQAKATFFYMATWATAYLRCQLPAKHLPGIANNDLWYSHTGDGVIVETDIEGDSVVFQYPGDQARALGLVVLKKNGYRVWVEVDDNYLEGEPAFMEKVGWKQGMGEAPFTIAQHRWIVKHADGVLVTTEQLAERYRLVNPNVVVAPNCVDTDDWDVYAGTREQRGDDGNFHVGWFASPSHTGDQALIYRAFDWCSQQGDVVGAVMGINPNWKIPYVPLPWTSDLSMYRLLMHSLDVGLCPVRSSVIGHGRSDIKACEYAMGGALPIVQDAPPYAAWTHGENCLKAKTAKDWLTHVRWACTHRDEARQLAAAAKRWTLEHRDIRTQVKIWEEALSA